MEIISQAYIDNAINNLDYSFSCTDTHPGYSCNQKGLQMFLRALKPVIKTYIPVHIVPFLLFKRKKFLKNPIMELLKLFLGIVRSVLFGAGYFCSYKRFNCLLFSHRKFGSIQIPICTALGGLPLVFQSPGRQTEIALYTVYKCMDIVYNMGKRRNMAVTIPAGNCVIAGTALCIICYHYFNNKHVIKESYVNLINKLLEEA